MSLAAFPVGLSTNWLGVAFFFGYFLLGEARRKYARQQGGTPSQFSAHPPSKDRTPSTLAGKTQVQSKLQSSGVAK